MTDPGMVAVSGAAGAGALVAASVPIVVGLLAVTAALATRRTLLLVVAVATLTSGLAHQAWSGLAQLPTGSFQGVAVLTADPQPSFGGWRWTPARPSGVSR